MLPDESLHIFNFSCARTLGQGCQRGTMILATDTCAFVQNGYHAGVALGSDGTAKALPQFLLHFGDDLGLDVIAQIRVLLALIIADRVRNRKRQLCNEDEQKHTFSIRILPIENVQVTSLDSEFSSYYSLNFDDTQAIWGIMDDGLNALLWEQNGLSFKISGYFDLSEIVKVAKGIEIK